MNRFVYILFFGALLFSATSFAQADVYPGTWQMEYSPASDSGMIKIELQIAAPEKNLLYPAQLKLQYNDFSATYNLLLVKKNIRQLGIGRNKIAVNETPFTLGNWTIYLNGIFDLSRDNKGNLVLTAERIYAKQYGVDMPDPLIYEANERIKAIHIRDFLKDTDIRLKKTNTDPLPETQADSILHPYPPYLYYGVMDTVYVKTNEGTLNFSGTKKTENGVVSVMLNGRIIIDQNDLGYKKPVEEIILDTGLNILTFFADNYGKSVTTTGKLNLEFGNKKITMSFADKLNTAATVIVLKIYYTPEKEKEEKNSFQDSILRELSESDLQRDIQIYHYPDKAGTHLIKTEPARTLAEKTLLRDAKLVGSVKANAQQIILAVWDDAVEDGDSISLSINGKWIVQGFAVKKKPQFIAVSLEPGINNITFIADNLGSIIPNTSILEIIDGKQRKSFMIDTDLGQNNLIRISYDYKPGG